MTLDAHWHAAAAFVRDRRLEPSRVIAPREMADLLPGVVAYERAHALAPELVEAVVVHKGLIDEIGRAALKTYGSMLEPGFADEVFVVLHRGPADRGVVRSEHWQAYLRTLGTSIPAPALPKRLLSSLRHGVEAIAARVPVGEPARTAVYLGDHRALTRSVHGHKLYVDTRDLSLAPHILLDGEWERWITGVFRELVKPGMTVVDIGANIGWYSVLAAESVGEAGRVISFEANPDVAELLWANLSVNGFLGRSEVVAKAAHAQSGRATLHRYRRHMGSSSLWATEAHARLFHDALDPLEVETVAIDEHLAPGTRVDLIKIDAEGAEPFVLEGAMRVISENRAIKILLEFAPQILAVSWSAKALHDLISQLGFEVHRVAHDGALVRSRFEDLMALPHCDVLLTRG